MDGSWGAWSPPGKCSSSCGEGLQLSIRTCDHPAPKYGGRFCAGPSARSSVCQSPCPGNRYTNYMILCYMRGSSVQSSPSSSVSRCFSLQLTGSGLVGPVGGSVLLPVTHKAKLPSGFATARVLTLPPHPILVAQFARVTTGKQRTASTCLSALVRLSAPLPVSLNTSSIVK